MICSWLGIPPPRVSPCRHRQSNNIDILKFLFQLQLQRTFEEKNSIVAHLETSLAGTVV